MMERITESSPRLKARVAGMFYLLAALTAAFAEGFVRGRLLYAAGLLGGVNVALIFHGFYCLLVGYLVFRSAFLPRILGMLMAIGGLAWLTNLSTPLTNQLSPYNVVSGFVGEGSLMLWLLVIGLNSRGWHARAGGEAHGLS